ncbi:MAG TPA: helicase-related protein [Candidatus Nanoarchaeia archaeon]|nr:helicase-related protein [Candidatus Nanoarchaeia archaeon]
MKTRQESKPEPILEIAADTLDRQKQALVFVNSKRSAEKTAEDIAKFVSKNKQADSEHLGELSEKVLKALSNPTKQCERLARCIKQGVAFHHAGLVSKQRELVEDNFRNGNIKFICCTPTLAAGLDLPAFRAVIKDLKRYGRNGMEWIAVLEYLQMAGRAGRPKFDSLGESIIIAKTGAEKKDAVERFIYGSPEDIFSKLAVEPVLRTYILSLISTRFVGTEEELFDFFEKTFWAHQYRDFNSLKSKVKNAILLLNEYKFVESGRQGINVTEAGRRVAELYIDPYTANNLIAGMKNAVKKGADEKDAKDITPFSFLQLISNTIEIRPVLRVKTKEWDDVMKHLDKNSQSLLVQEPSMFDTEYDSFLSSVKTAMFFEEWISEKDEEFMMEKYDVRPGEIHAKLETADWLVYSMIELGKLLRMQPVLNEISKLRIRLKYGAREEILPLLRLENIGRARARKLFNNKIRNIADVRKTDISILAQLVGKNIAEQLKKQVSDEIVEVKEGKRKGQISVRDFDE